MPLQLSNYEFLEALPPIEPAEECWKARRVSDGTITVVKVLPALAENEGPAARRFLEEADRLIALRHPGLVAVLDVGIKSGRPFYVTEYVEGDPVSAICARGPLAEADALLLAEGVALPLAHAWREALLHHGGLTPENVLIDRQDVVRVADLGLCHVLGEVAAAQGGGSPCCHQAPHYAAPERATPGVAADYRADMYALGALLHHLLTGQMPFGDSSDAEALTRHATGFLPDPRATRPRISDGCVWLLESLTAKDPVARPASWESVLADIAAVRAGRTPASPRPAPGAATVRREERFAPRPPRRASVRRARAPRSAATFNRSGLPPGITGEGAGPQRVVVSRSLHRRVEKLHRQRRRGSGFSVGLFVALAAAALAFHHFIWPQLQPPALQNTQPVADTESPPSGQRIGVRRPTGELVLDAPPPTIEPPQPPSGEGGPPAAELSMPAADKKPESDVPRKPEAPTEPQDSLFVSGARHFNEAIELFREFEKNREGSKNLLPRIERLAQLAADDFEAYQRRAPDDAKGKKYAEQTYRLIASVRQWMLTLGVRHDGRDLPPRRNAQPSRPPTALNPPAFPTAPGLRLAPGWNAPLNPESSAARELSQLLGSRGRPAVNLAPDPALRLLDNVPYLMSARDLARAWRTELPEGQMLAHPIFPARSLKAFVLPREVQQGYPLTVVLTDLDHSVVGVQFVAEEPLDRPVLPAVLFAEQWTIFDLVAFRARSSDNLRIAHRVRTGERIIQIETEMVELDYNRAERLGRSLYRARLILAQPIVDLLLHRLALARSAPSG